MLQSASAIRKEPPRPLTSVIVVLHVKSEGPIGALPHVVAAISACLDHALPQFWTIARACEANSLPLLDRLVWHASHDVAAAATDPFYWQYQCRLGLVAAVKHGNLAMVEWLHEYCPSVLPYTGMIEAARAGQLVILKWLADHHERAVWIPQIMDAAASTNQMHVLQWLHEQPKNGGCTTKAFTSAVVNGHLDAIKWLQEYYADIVVNPFDEVIEATRNGHSEVVKYLYAQPQFYLNFNVAIERAAEAGNLELTQWLLSRSTERHFGTLVDFAARGGHFEVFLWLYENLSKDEQRGSIDDAARGGHFEIIQWIHSNLFKPGERYYTQAMNNAALKGHFDVLKWLHEHNTERGTTRAMDNAATGGHLEIVQWLHANRTEGSRNALTNACENGHLEVAKWLFENVTQECADHVIDLVASGGHLDVIKWIAEHNVGGGACSSEAMYNAAYNGHLNVVQWLHEHGVEDETPCAIDWAAESGHADIVKWLCEHRSEDYTGMALRWAAQRGHFEVALVLYAKLGTDSISPNVIWFRDECIEHLEIVQWIYGKNPLAVYQHALTTDASYMSAVLEHVLGLPPVSVGVQVAP